MFVVFEGIDGSGKTTVSNLVAKRLRADGLSVTHVRENGKFASRVSEGIRELGRDAKNLDLTPQAEFLLYVARDVQLIDQALRPALKKSDVVLADRFLYTAEVLGRYGRQLEPSFADPILKAAAADLTPDLVVLVDVDPALARARRKSTKLVAVDQRPPSRKGLSGAGLAHRLRRGYLECAARSPSQWLIVANDQPLDLLVDRVSQLIIEATRESVALALSAYRQKAVAQGLSTSARNGPLPRSPADALACFLGWVDDRANLEPRVAAYFLSGLSGPGIDERRHAVSHRAPEVILAGLTGLGDSGSWELRQSLSATHGNWVARSLVGIPGGDVRAAALRQMLEPLAPHEVAESLEGWTDELAWEARERLYAVAPGAVVSSLAGLDSVRAWAVRDRWFGEHAHELDTSYEWARSAARSLRSLDGERAWAMRERTFAAAPIAALASLEGAVGERSWKWRQQYLAQAPKAIMTTLSGLDTAQAWNLRRAVAHHCKEALDSMSGLDHPEAWQMREEHQDRWPSTVVKTLGALAFAGRGQALIERQLKAYPSNISLLKHTSAVALGLDRDDRGFSRREIE